MTTTLTPREKDARDRYRARAKAQAFAWAEGRPYHNRIDDECCPDFSCCHPDLFEHDAEKRWRAYRAEYGDAS